MSERACFHVMVESLSFGSPGHSIVATFHADDEADLLRELVARFPLRGALVAVNEPALAMLLRASVERMAK